MNIPDLKKINLVLSALKGISFADVRNFFNENQVVAFSAGIIIVNLIVGLVLTSGRLMEYNNLTSELQVLRSKEEPIKQYEKAMKSLGGFQEGMRPALLERDMIPYITKAADRRMVQIESFDPVQSRQKSFYRETGMTFYCSADSFKNILLFIHDIETSKYFFKIDMINLTKSTVGTGLSLNISISTIELMDYGKKNTKKK